MIDIRSKPPKSTIRKVEEGLGAGLITGALVYVGYAHPFGSSGGWASFPYLAGFASSISLYFVLSEFSHNMPKPLFNIALLAPGFVGGLVAFALSPHPISIVWYLLGGAIVFLALWFAEMRETQASPPA